MAKTLHVTTHSFEYLGRLVKMEGEHHMGKHWIRLGQPCRVEMQRKGDSVSLSLAPLSEDKIYKDHIEINLAHAEEVITLDESGELYRVYVRKTSGLVLQ